jgi:hypothetical protein
VAVAGFHFLGALHAKADLFQFLGGAIDLVAVHAHVHVVAQIQTHVGRDDDDVVLPAQLSELEAGDQGLVARDATDLDDVRTLNLVLFDQADEMGQAFALFLAFGAGNAMVASFALAAVRPLCYWGC